MADQGDKEQNNENVKENLRDSSKCNRDPSKTEQSGKQRNNKESNRKTQHLAPPKCILIVSARCIRAKIADWKQVK
jgi:hypothetical protein